jgi:hypothetical protein
MKYYNCYKNANYDYKRQIFRSLVTCYKNHPDYRIWIRNLFNEHFLPEHKMSEILEILFDTFGYSCENKFKLLKSHGYKSLCCGGHCDLGIDSVVVGTVIPKNRFRNYLLNEYSHKFTKFTVDDLIEQLLYDTKGIDAKFKDIKFKEIGRIIWLTWDGITFSDNPFVSLKTNYAEEALTALGLGFDSYKNQEFLSFIFDTKCKDMKRPTICDSDYNDFFRPTEFSYKKNGILHPLNYGFYSIKGVIHEISTAAMNLPESVNWGNSYLIKNLNKCLLLKPS